MVIKMLVSFLLYSVAKYKLVTFKSALFWEFAAEHQRVSHDKPRLCSQMWIKPSDWYNKLVEIQMFPTIERLNAEVEK